MAIQQLEVDGFRSLRSSIWTPGSLNLVVGPNGAGKSNLLRLLEFISNAARGKMADTVQSAGGIVPLLWNHSARSLGWKVNLDPVDPGLDRERDALTYQVTIQQLGHGSSYEIRHDLLSKLRDQKGRLKANPLKFFERDPGHKVVFDSKERRLVLPPEGTDDSESLLSQVADPLGYPVLTSVKRSIEAWRIHHDVHVERGSPVRSPATTQHARLVAPDGANLPAVLHTLYTGAREWRGSI